MISARKLSPKESRTESSTPHQFSAMFVTSSSPVPLNNTEDLRTWLQRDFPVSHFQLPAETREPTTTETFSPNSSQFFAQLDREDSCWRTSQICLLTNTAEPFSENWPRSGMTCDGIAYRRPPVARLTSATGCGSSERMLCKTPSEYDGRTKHPKKSEYRLGNSGTLSQEVTSGFLETVRKWPTDQLWPTPNTLDGLPPKSKKSLLREATVTRKGRSQPANLRDAVSNMHMWPTPRSSEWKGVGPLGSKSQAHMSNRKYLCAIVQEENQQTGKLNPEWVDWLMGVPIGFSGLKPLATHRFHKWLQQHGDF